MSTHAAALPIRGSCTLSTRALSIALLCTACASALAQSPAIPREALRSGASFAGADVRAMQADDTANPGMLWVERGAGLWRAGAVEGGPSCAACHGDAAQSMKGVAARYPAYDATAKAIFDVEDRIQACRVERQHGRPLARESEDLLALTAFVAHQSRGMPVAVSIEGPARPFFEQGRTFYYTRHGQMNMSCANCHEQNWGRRLLAETLSQGHPTAFPAYRLEWQALGSLARRLRACLFGIRAEMPAADAPGLEALELFLAWRAQGLDVETPGVRR